MANEISFYSIRVVMLLVLLSGSSVATLGDADIGVCWGRNSWQPLPPPVVVQLLKNNGIRRVKLFGADADMMEALEGSGIDVEAMVANVFLSAIAKDLAGAQGWLFRNIIPFLYPGGVDVRYIAVGNEPFLAAHNGEYDNLVIPALQNMYKALQAQNLDTQIKLVVPLNLDILSVSFPPSASDLRPDIRDQVTAIAQFLHETGSPFSVNIYPFLTVHQQPPNAPIPLSFVLMDGSNASTSSVKTSEGSFVDSVSKLVYNNIFDGAYDAVVHLMNKLGVPDVEVIVGEIGWPSDGQGDLRGYASLDMARRFNNGIIQHFMSGYGTPLRPGKKLNGFIFALLDEDNKTTGAGAFERHWGLFHADGTPKYPLDLEGKGEPKNLVPAKNLPLFPAQWCVANPNASTAAISTALAFACAPTSASDCTPTVVGGNCYFNGDLRKLASYAFNSYYQLNRQAADACSFGGASIITTTNPSTDKCIFMRGVVALPLTGSLPAASLSLPWLAIAAVMLVHAVLSL